MADRLLKIRGRSKYDSGESISPHDSASQVSSNILAEEGEEAGGDSARRLASQKLKQAKVRDDSSKSKLPESVSGSSRHLARLSDKEHRGTKSKVLKASNNRRSHVSRVSTSTSRQTKPESIVPVGSMLSTKSESPASKADSKISEATASNFSKAPSVQSGSSIPTFLELLPDIDNAESEAPIPNDGGSLVSTTKSDKNSATTISKLPKHAGVLASELAASTILPASSRRSSASSSSGTGRLNSVISSKISNSDLATEKASEVSKATSVKSKFSIMAANKDQSIISGVSTASTASSQSTKTNGKISSGSRRSRGSDKSKALVLANRKQKVSPLASEIRWEDLDDTYSISIRERGLANTIGKPRGEMLAAILQANPDMGFDNVSAIVDRRLAGSDMLRKQDLSERPAPRSVVSRTAGVPGGRDYTGFGKSRSVVGSGLSSNVSKVPSSRKTNFDEGRVRSSTLETSRLAEDMEAKTSKLPPLSTQPAASSSLRSRPLVPTSVTSSASLPTTLETPPLQIARAHSVLPLSLGKPSYGQGTSASDLLAIANIRALREAQRAQAVAQFEASRISRNGDTSRYRIAELELAKQSLEDSRTLTRLQNQAIHDDKLALLAQHAHKDQLDALARAESAESDRRHTAQENALQEAIAQERMRNRQRRGDMARDERRKQEDAAHRQQMAYERLDHDQKMEKIEAFERLSEAGAPRLLPQPRRSSLHLETGWAYRNPGTGGDGTVTMRVGKGCSGSGSGSTGICGKCGLGISEHPVRLKSDGSVIGSSGKVLSSGPPSAASSAPRPRSRSTTKRDSKL